MLIESWVLYFFLSFTYHLKFNINISVVIHVIIFMVYWMACFGWFQNSFQERVQNSNFGKDFPKRHHWTFYFSGKNITIKQFVAFSKNFFPCFSLGFFFLFMLTSLCFLLLVKLNIWDLWIFYSAFLKIKVSSGYPRYFCKRAI